MDMQRTLTLSLTLLLTAAALAGCADEADAPLDDVEPTPEVTPPAATTPATTPVTTPVVNETPEETPLDSSTYALATAGLPAQVKPGQRFNFTLYANGTVERESDHVGAHYADNDTTNPPAAGRKDCEHVTGDLPGVFTVHCTIHETGTWFVWGHARINDSGELRNWWTEEPTVVHVRDYDLNATGAPTTAVTSGQNFTFQLTITGSENVTSEHLGAHYWNATQDNPTAANSSGACAHHPEPVGAVGTFTITCAIPNSSVGAQTFYVRGHLRLVEGGTTLDWWSEPFEVSVLGNPLG